MQVRPTSMGWPSIVINAVSFRQNGRKFLFGPGYWNGIDIITFRSISAETHDFGRNFGNPKCEISLKRVLSGYIEKKERRRGLIQNPYPTHIFQNSEALFLSVSPSNMLQVPNSLPLVLPLLSLFTGARGCDTVRSKKKEGPLMGPTKESAVNLFDSIKPLMSVDLI